MGQKSTPPRDASLFEADAGVTQGRVVAADGTAHFVLGSADPAWLANVRVGDWVEVAQDLECTGLHLVRLRGTATVPAELPTGARSTLTIRTLTTVLTEVHLRPGTRSLNDVAANISRLVGTHHLAVRLSLVAD
jgi:hypothetical protein